jgi:hypothetical protein
VHTHSREGAWGRQAWVLLDCSISLLGSSLDTSVCAHVSSTRTGWLGEDCELEWLGQPLMMPADDDDDNEDAARLPATSSTSTGTGSGAMMMMHHMPGHDGAPGLTLLRERLRDRLMAVAPEAEAEAQGLGKQGAHLKGQEL